MEDTEPCAECGDPVRLDLAHWPHHGDCPNYGVTELKVTCDCFRPVHAECCPDCR